MDRNVNSFYSTPHLVVATREGGVDRNFFWQAIFPESKKVATREGGVDRNVCTLRLLAGLAGSPPARVAWIETYLPLSIITSPERRHPRGWRG